MIECKIKNDLSMLYGKEELSDSYINFQIDLIEITDKYIELTKSIVIEFPEKEIINRKFENGSPLISFIPIVLPLEILTSCSKEVISVFQSHKICSSDVSEWFESKADEKFIKEITKAIISFDRDAIQRFSEKTPIDGPTLNLVSREIVRSIFHSLTAHATNFISFKNWTEGFCPVCGDLPSFARFSKEKEGKRYLWCAKCDMEWEFQRICCPFCKNNDHTKLKFLTTNHREELRIDVCENCKGYIKTIDERKIENDEETVYFKENVASLYLDMVAEENGYTIQLPTIQNTKITFYPARNFH